MNLLNDPTWAFACAAAFAVSALLTRAGIRYGHRLNLIDEPGRRRSHSVPTPRGGGIGIVTAIVVCALVPAMLDGYRGEPHAFFPVTAALLVVAAVGWIDDHRGLGRWVRFFAQWFAGFLVLVGYQHWSAWTEIEGYGLQETAVVLFLVLAVVWSINLHNFMDGINGLLASQAVFVLGAHAILMYSPYPSPMFEERILAIGAFAVLGFLPFNFPRARIFMGDVGSGALGLLVAIAAYWQMQRLDIALGTGIVLCSAFVTDASATLALRIVRGRRWYSPHREHLYQWLVRSGWSHSQAVGWYMAWNVFIVLPVVWWMNRGPIGTVESPDPVTVMHFRDWTSSILGSAPVVAGVYVLALLVWISGKRYCLRQAGLRVRGTGVQ